MGSVQVVIFVFATTILCAATVFAVRGGVLARPRMLFSGFDGIGVLTGFVVFTVASAAFGPVFALSLIVSLLLHEFGHVIGYRMIGHEDARFRLVPLLSGAPMSDHPVRTEGQAFFVALMGPGVSIGPMVLAYTLSATLANSNPEVSGNLRVFAVTCGTLNFLNLLPFWPLDGGRCTRIFAGNFWPTLAPALTVFMTAAFTAAALRTDSLTLFILAGVGVQSLFQKGEPKREKLGESNALTAMAAYAFTLATHFCGGYWLMSHYL